MIVFDRDIPNKNNTQVYGTSVRYGTVQCRTFWFVTLVHGMLSLKRKGKTTRHISPPLIDADLFSNNTFIDSIKITAEKSTLCDDSSLSE